MEDKSYFASANTGSGFINCFDSIGVGDGMQYILKGAPGCGKNTIMRKLAGRYISVDGKVESFYCSSDPNSLDGVRFIGTGISIVDGTAPHVTEAVFPGLTHKIIDLGRAVLPGIERYRGELFSLAHKKKEGYEVLYRLMSASKEILKNDIMEMPMSDLSIDSLCLPEHSGVVRHLFLSSLEKDFTESNSYSNLVYIDANYRSADALFHKAEASSIERGLSAICLLNTVNPEFYDAFYIPDSDTLYKAVPVSDPILVSLTARAAEKLAQNRGLHLKMESIYHEFVDFEIINDITNSLVAETDGREFKHETQSVRRY